MYDIYFTFHILKTASESKALDIKTSRKEPKKKKKCILPYSNQKFFVYTTVVQNQTNVATRDTLLVRN